MKKEHKIYLIAAIAPILMSIPFFTLPVQLFLFDLETGTDYIYDIKLGIREINGEYYSCVAHRIMWKFSPSNVPALCQKYPTREKIEINVIKERGCPTTSLAVADPQYHKYLEELGC